MQNDAWMHREGLKGFNFGPVVWEMILEGGSIFSVGIN